LTGLAARWVLRGEGFASDRDSELFATCGRLVGRARWSAGTREAIDPRGEPVGFVAFGCAALIVFDFRIERPASSARDRAAMPGLSAAIGVCKVSEGGRV